VETGRIPLVIREPAELQIDDDGQVALPLGLLAEAGLDAGSRILAFSDGDGRLVLQREADAVESLLRDGTL
jgi:bifunctional DNA-binding transcriptional regulator/antitoxin component of YhaV-PrlF toxin-antitoxin module